MFVEPRQAQEPAKRYHIKLELNLLVPATSRIRFVNQTKQALRCYIYIYILFYVLTNKTSKYWSTSSTLYGIARWPRPLD